MGGTAKPTTTATMQQISSSSSSVAVGTAAASAEEEAYKRNTDCVYFLASPLTCKKGSECEYRHSDIARVNPRDCWYWLHGNCMNPKCGFRHPPLDGFLGTQGPNPSEPIVPPSQPATMPATTPAAPTSGKQGIACIFFQRGHCLRGDWCPFLHAPYSINNKASLSQAASVTTEPPTFEKTFGGHERSNQEQKIAQPNVPKSIGLLHQAKPMNKVHSAPAKNDLSIKKKISTSAMDDELQRHRSAGGTPVDDQNLVIWSNRVQQPVSLNEHRSTNGKDAEEVSREPSPGFDVLVDDQLRDSDYYHGEDQFGRTVDHEGRCEYFDNHTGDYSSMVDADQDMYHESHGYDTYEQLQGQYAREQRRSSSERMLGGLSQPERRHGRPESPDEVGGSDLRYRLTKHRRSNGLRSVINQDYARERFDDRGYQSSQRDPRNERGRQESSFSSRLQGRIRIPGRSAAADGNDLRSDRENEKGKDHSGLSQGRLQISSRLRDRIKGNLQDDINIDSWSNRGLRMGRDTVSDNSADFAGPKSLAELKSQRNFHRSEDRSEQHLNDQLGKRKFSKLQYQQETGGDASFEGPKPLEEILKRKKGSGLPLSGSGTSSGENEDATLKKSEENPTKTEGKGETQTGHSLPSKNDSDLSNDNKNENKVTPEVNVRAEGSLSADGQSVDLQNMNKAEVEDGMIVEDGAEDQELETYEQGDEDSYYEQGDGEDYNLEEGDNVGAEEEYLDDDGDDDDDDDDDFAKKMGVMY